MESRPERITWWTLVGFLVLAVLIGIVATPIALWAGGERQLIVVRVAAALFLAFVLYRLVVVLRVECGIDQASPADLAIEPRRIAVKADPVLLRLAQETRTGLRRHMVPMPLQERLRRLSLQRGRELPGVLRPEADRRFTWQDADRVIDFLERDI